MKTYTPTLTWAVLVCLTIAPNFAKANYVPVFACNSQCVAINWDKKTVSSMGSVTGDSNYSDQEAFLDMRENCKKMLQTSGITGEVHLAKNIFAGSDTERSEYESSQTTEVNNQSGAAAARRGIFSKKIAIAFSSSSYSQENKIHSFYDHDQFSFSVEQSEAKDCELIRTNPEGTPKYIGPGTPLGWLNQPKHFSSQI